MINGKFTILIFEDEDPIGRNLFKKVVDDCPDAQVAYYSAIGPKKPDASKNLPANFIIDLDMVLNSDVILLDLKIPISPPGAWNLVERPGGFNGEEFLLQCFNRLSLYTSVCILTGFGVQTSHLDKLTSPVDFRPSEVHVGPYLHKWDKNADSEETIRTFVKQKYSQWGKRVSSEAFLQVWFASQHDLPVLIVGQSGTGKELIASWIHAMWSDEQRSRHPKWGNLRMATVNCAALAGELARSELFGHVKGAYTGAEYARLGACLDAAGIPPTPTPSTKGVDGYRDFLKSRYNHLLSGYQTEDDSSLGYGDLDFVFTVNKGKERAPENQECLGTLFLDEFGDLPLEVQVLLLRYLNSFEIDPLGYGGLIRGAKVRVIAATSDPNIAKLVGLDEKVFGGKRQEGHQIREDLLYRLEGQIIGVTPLNGEAAVDLVELWSSVPGMLSWNTEAKKFLKEQVDTAVKHHAFGNKRALRRMFELTQNWVRCAPKMGKRDIPPGIISKEAISAWWKPIPIDEVEAESLATEHHESQVCAVPDAPGSSSDDRPKRSVSVEASLGAVVVCDDSGVRVTRNNITDTFRGGLGRALRLLWKHRGANVEKKAVCKAYFPPGQKASLKQEDRKLSDLASALNKRVMVFGLRIEVVTESAKGSHGRPVVRSAGLRLEELGGKLEPASASPSK